MSFIKLNIILLFTLLLCCESTFAKKIIYPIEIISNSSDFIVSGNIKSVTDTSYTFKVTNIIKGNCDSILTIQQFENWTCDSRFAKPKIGEELLLFLENNNGLLEIINGSTGERPINNNQVMLFESTIPYDYNSPIYTIDIAEFSIGIKFFLECYSFKYKENYLKNELYKKCTESEIKAKTQQNTFFDWLNKKIRNKYY
jgi:hypothetical protein